MNALQEARKHKARIEVELTRNLEAFNRETGLHIEAIGIETIDITTTQDSAPHYTYRVWTEISVK
jgi:hypothetical protein